MSKFRIYQHLSNQHWYIQERVFFLWREPAFLWGESRPWKGFKTKEEAMAAIDYHRKKEQHYQDERYKKTRHENKTAFKY